MLTACLRDGKTFQRGEVEHLTARRRSAPPRRDDFADLSHLRAMPCAPQPANRAPLPEMKVSGALCLMSDLTELTALQKQIRWKENLAALGEMSAGIAHEFKNALATISGYAQMIRSEATTGRHPRFGRAHPRPDSRAHPCGHRIPALREASGNLLRDGLRCRPSSNASPKTCTKLFRNARSTCEGTFLDLPGDEALIRQAL